MIFITRKQFERKVDEILFEREERERIHRRFDELDRRLSDLEFQVHRLKMEIDPEYRRMNTPVSSVPQANEAAW